MKYRRAPSYYEEEIGFGVVCEGKTPEQAKLEAIVGDLIWRSQCRKCDQVGHRIVDEGYGGPDHGCVDLHCLRCGWSQHTTLY